MFTPSYLQESAWTRSCSWISDGSAAEHHLQLFSKTQIDFFFVLSVVSSAACALIGAEGEQQHWGTWRAPTLNVKGSEIWSAGKMVFSEKVGHHSWKA